MNKFREVLRKYLGNNIYQHLVLTINYYSDYNLYRKHSSIFNKDTYEKIESEITLRYHSIEKGFLHFPIRERFAQAKVSELIQLIKGKKIVGHYNNIQIQSAFNSLCKYYEFHDNKHIDISDYYIKDDYFFFKNNLYLDSEIIKKHTNASFFAENKKDFKSFSFSRCSVRNFTGEKVSKENLQKVIDLANNAPSVCNRQPVNIYVVENKSLIDQILKIQGGLAGYSQKLSQLIVLTSNRNYFYSTGERNQLYTDGGIYLMNLLYALHYYKVGACPAHWGLPVHADKKAKNLLKLKESEQIVCLVAIGIPTEEFSTTLSARKQHDENLFVID